VLQPKRPTAQLMSIPGPSRPSLSPSVSKPHSRQSSYTGPLRSPLRASSSFLELTGEQSDDHPLIPPKHRGTHDEDGDDEDSDFWSWNGGDESDISRPTLRRLTSETEKQVAGSSRSGGTGSVGTGSARGSLDLLRMSAVEKEQHGREVEVLLHQVSVPGHRVCPVDGLCMNGLELMALLCPGETGRIASWYCSSVWYRCETTPC
jgi:hypothetical protein